MIEKVVKGFHATIFAYGQTGSGKTYTMEGYNYRLQRNGPPVPIITKKTKNLGLIPRAISSLYQKITKSAKKHNRTYKVFCSYLQIYNERIYDLLNPTGKIGQKESGLRLRWNHKEEFHVENLYVFECEKKEDLMKLFHIGIKNKVMGFWMFRKN